MFALVGSDGERGTALVRHGDGYRVWCCVSLPGILVSWLCRFEKDCLSVNNAFARGNETISCGMADVGIVASSRVCLCRRLVVAFHSQDIGAAHRVFFRSQAHTIPLSGKFHKLMFLEISTTRPKALVLDM